MDNTTLVPAMALALASNFGNVEQWGASFVALAAAHGAAGGELRLELDPASGTLVNRWSTGATADDAIDTLMTVALPAASGDALADLDWPRAYQRYQDAVHAASAPFAAHDIAGAHLIDVRRAGVLETATTMLPGAVWRDPAKPADWAHELQDDRPVLVCCVYGHEVGRVTAMRLRALGVNARFLVGGIDGWEHTGRAVVAKPAAPS